MLGVFAADIRLAHSADLGLIKRGAGPRTGAPVIQMCSIDRLFLQVSVGYSAADNAVKFFRARYFRQGEKASCLKHPEATLALKP